VAEAFAHAGVARRIGSLKRLLAQMMTTAAVLPHMALRPLPRSGATLGAFNLLGPPGATRHRHRCRAATAAPLFDSHD